MKFIRCQSGHFYDSEKYASCPHCAGESNVGADDLTMPGNTQDDIVTAKKMNPPATGITPTVALESETPSKLTEQLESTKGSSSQKNDVTVGYYKKRLSADEGGEPVVGWLVCTAGKHYGEDFRLRAGRNFIGRADSMDVALRKDGTISREKHMVILYEPKANIFMVQPGDSKELSYLNDEVILEAKVIKPYDIISVGESELTFIPFCSDVFQWQQKEAAKEDK